MRLQRLLNVPEGTRLNGLHYTFITAAAGNNHDRNPEDFVAQMTEQLESVHARKLDIGDDDLGTELRILGEGFLATGYTQHLAVPFAKQGFVSFARVIFVFDDQNALERCIFGSHLQSESTSSFPIFQGTARECASLKPASGNDSCKSILG